MAPERPTARWRAMGKSGFPVLSHGFSRAMPYATVSCRTAPSPTGGGNRVPPPSGGRLGGGRRRARGAVARTFRPRSQVTFISALCAMCMTVSREHRLLEQGCGETRFPHPPAHGRVWEGCALPGRMFIPSGCGGAAWTAGRFTTRVELLYNRQRSCSTLQGRGRERSSAARKSTSQTTQGETSWRITAG